MKRSEKLNQQRKKYVFLAPNRSLVALDSLKIGFFFISREMKNAEKKRLKNFSRHFRISLARVASVFSRALIRLV